MSKNSRGSAVRSAATALAVSTMAMVSTELWIGGFGVDAAHAAGPIRSVADECDWYEFGWAELSPQEKRAWSSVGWNATLWDSDSESSIPSAENRNWDALTADQRSALSSLGYNRASWNDEDC